MAPPVDSHGRDASRADDEPAPATDRVHDASWSANLEAPRYAADRSLLERHAVRAVEHTAAGRHVNLVTHEAHGHPSGYLYATLEERFGDDVEWTYVDQCGCGGHVVRVHVE